MRKIVRSKCNGKGGFVKRTESYLAIGAIVAVWVFIALTLYCYCPFVPPVDLLIPFKAIVVLGAFFWVAFTILGFFSLRGIFKLFPLISMVFFIYALISFLPLLFSYEVRAVFLGGGNANFCWTIGSIIICFGMVVLTYFTFKPSAN
jgi:hypothetical protein